MYDFTIFSYLIIFYNRPTKDADTSLNCIREMKYGITGKKEHVPLPNLKTKKWQAFINHG